MRTEKAGPDIVKIIDEEDTLQGEVWILEEVVPGNGHLGLRGSITLFHCPDYFEVDPMKELALRAFLELGWGKPSRIEVLSMVTVTAFDQNDLKYLFPQLGFIVYLDIPLSPCLN